MLQSDRAISASAGRHAVLSFAQERLWFLAQLQPDHPFYNVPTAWRLTGALDVDALRRALAEIVRRHESLRTTFADVDGAPVQTIVPYDGFTLVREDWSSRGSTMRDAELDRRIRAEAGRPFDLASGPLFRATLLRLAPDEHVLLLNLHHLVADGWSIGVLVRELTALYGAFRKQRPSPLAELPSQYADYAQWQRRELQRDSSELAYWTRQLAGAPDVLRLPTDYPRPAMQRYRGACEAIDVSREVLTRLKAIGRAQGATLFMVLVSAFQVLLARYAGEEDILVGSQIAGRTRKELEPLVGLFVNMIVLRTDLGGHPRFRDVLQRVRQVALDAFANQEVPFEQVVGELQPERSLSYSPIVQVAFQLRIPLDENEIARAADTDLSLTRIDHAAETTKFDLMLDIDLDRARSRASFTYSNDLFEAATIRRLAGHFTRLLEQVSDNPDVPIADIDLMPEDEREQVVVAWNRTESARGLVATWRRFEAQAERRPDAEALRRDDQAMTYAELDRASNRLAHYLVEHGIQPESRVGIVGDRSIDMVVALLATMKAGGAFVPLDPAYPPARLRYLVADAGATVVIAPGGAPWNDGEGSSALTIDPRAHAAAIGSRPSDAPRAASDRNNLAYLIYTSGTTGAPKGVMVTHGGLSSLLRSDVARLSEQSRVLQFASLSFDVGVWEICQTLVSGGTLILAAKADLLPGSPLADTLRRHGVTVASLPPSVLAVLQPERLPAIRTVISAGEPLTQSIAERWSRTSLLINAYGPTEATVLCSSAVCSGDARTPSIGGPLGDVQLYVLDTAGRPVPVGIPGELHIGGLGVARGYLHAPRQTAASFIPNPFGTGSRLYRTGDRVRWRADGTLEFIGRLDRQVKVRGFRIELGEVESAIVAVDKVKDARVVVHGGGPASRLIAYVVCDASVETLRSHLRQTLPEYMVPSAFVRLDRLPLTVNGKLDVKALPAPAYARDPSFVAPRNPVEETIAEAWRDVLSIQQMSVTENFFDVGGTSLMLHRVHSRVRPLRRDLQLLDLFRYTTIEALAKFVSENGHDHDRQHLASSLARAEQRRRADRRRRR